MSKTLIGKLDINGMGAILEFRSSYDGEDHYSKLNLKDGQMRVGFPTNDMIQIAQFIIECEIRKLLMVNPELTRKEAEEHIASHKAVRDPKFALDPHGKNPVVYKFADHSIIHPWEVI